MRFLVFLAVNFRNYPYKLVDSNSVIMPRPLKVPKVFAFETAHFPAFNHDSYLLGQPARDSPEVLAIWALVQTSIEHQHWRDTAHRRPGSQFLVSSASNTPGADLRGVFKTPLEDLGKGRD